MRFLITRDFFKNVPKEKIEQVKNRIEYFYHEIMENKKTIFDAPKGFWVKKLRDNLYEFRVNSGDRVLFEFRDVERLGYGEKELVLLSFDKHDMVIIKGDRKDKKIVKTKLLEIEKNRENVEEIEETPEEIERNYKKINSKIMYEVTSDENLIQLIKNEDEYTYYYLNDEQYEILNDDFPLFLKGSAGSGKTTVAIRKAMEMEENYGCKVGYITFTRSLKENANEMYEKFRNPNYERVVEFYSLEELYEKQLKEKPVGIRIFEKFIYEYNPTFPKGVESLELYQEIRGIIKGSMGAKGAGNWDRDLEKKLIPKEDYLSLNKKYTVYSKETREEIYEFALKYQGWLEEKNHVDENDLARRMILEKKELFECIICDEIQDLTEIEIYMLKKLVIGGENLFFAGDIHQIINPTYFNFSRVKTLFYQDTSYVERELSKNYRSQKKIVDLANELSDLRGKYIGKLGEDYKEASILEGEDIFSSKKDIKFLKRLKNNTTIILVPTNKTKRELREELSEIANQILTVQDVKGLEFDSVVLYNFATELKKYWRKIFNGDAKTNQLYRYYFNLFYVGITRAKKRLLMMEEDSESDLLKKLDKHLIKFTAEGKRNFTLKSGEKDFLKEGKELLSRELFEEAISAFEKAGAKKYIRKAKDRLEAKNYFDENGEVKTIEYILNNENSISSYLESYVVVDKIGDSAFENKNYEKAKKYYEKSENFEKLAEIYERESKLEKGLEFAKKSDNDELIERLDKEIDKNKRALNLAKEILILSDKNIWGKNISFEEFENLDRKYIKTKEKRRFNEVQVILYKRFKDNLDKSKKLKISSPTKLLVRLSKIEGTKKSINYILENYADKINIGSLIGLIDSKNIMDKYVSHIKKDIDLNELLAISCDKGQLKNVSKFLELGADVETTSKKWMKPLFIAIQNEDIELVKLLVEKGANINALLEVEKEEVTPLKFALLTKNIDIINYLLEQDIDINTGAPIKKAIKLKNLKIIKKFFDLGVETKEEKLEFNLIYLALNTESEVIVKTILENNVELPKKDNEIRAMNVIDFRKNKNIFKLLIEAGYELSEEEMIILPRLKVPELIEIYLTYQLGDNYKEKIKKIVDTESKRVEKMDLTKEMELKYNFEKYKKGVKEDGES